MRATKGEFGSQRPDVVLCVERPRLILRCHPEALLEADRPKLQRLVSPGKVVAMREDEVCKSGCLQTQTPPSDKLLHVDESSLNVLNWMGVLDNAVKVQVDPDHGIRDDAGFDEHLLRANGDE